MPSLKRKPLGAGLQRRVRARREASEDIESFGSPSDNEDHPAIDGEEENISESEGSAAEVVPFRSVSYRD